MNQFNNNQMLIDTFRSMSYPVLINGKEQEVFITTAYLGEYEKRHISSLEPFKQGDIVSYEGELFLIIEEVVTMRGMKYRSSMMLSNYNFENEVLGEPVKTIIGYDERERPIYEITYPNSYTEYLPTVVFGYSRKDTGNQQIPMSQTTVLMYMQYSVENETKFAVSTTISHPYKHRTFKVTGQDITRNGLLILEIDVASK